MERKTWGDRITMFDLGCFCALTLATLAIAGRIVVLIHEGNDDGTLANRTIAAMLTGLGCVVFVIVVPCGLLASERLRRDLLTARRVTDDLIDRLRVGRKSPEQRNESTANRAYQTLDSIGSTKRRR